MPPQKITWLIKGKLKGLMRLGGPSKGEVSKREQMRGKVVAPTKGSA